MSTRTAPMGIGIAGMGVGLPETVRTNADWPASFAERDGQRTEDDVVAPVDEAARRRAADIDPEIAAYARTQFDDPFRGSKERRVVGDGTAVALEVAACKEAIEDAGIEPRDVDMMLGYSLVTDRVNLGNHGSVAHALGLRRSVEAMEVSGGCRSFFHQLHLAVRLVQSGAARHVLIYVSSTISRIVDYRQPSSVIPGDGSVAAVVGRLDDDQGFIGHGHLLYGEHHDGILAVPSEHPEIPWWRTDLYEERILMRRVDDAAAHFAGARAATLCRDTCAPLFDRTGYAPEDVSWFVCAQATSWFAPALAEAIGVDPARTLPPADHFERFGHMMAASGPMNLYLSRELGRISGGDLVLGFAPGVGFGTVATLMRW